jgi:hypothetical protein
MTYSIERQLACVEREIRMREHVFPRWVEQKKISQKFADEELAVMRAVAETLRELAPAAKQPTLF